MKRALLVAVLLAGLLHAVVPAQTPPALPDALQFFKNYFVTGSYVVGGVGLQGQGVGGVASGPINISGVPENGDVVAAFLYWQAVTRDDGTAGKIAVTFNGMPLSSVDPLTSAQGSFGSQLGVGTPPCWSGGGGTGSSGGAHKTYTDHPKEGRCLIIFKGQCKEAFPDGGQ